jgi:hypothetical protein
MLRVLGLIGIFGVTSIAWWVLAALMEVRTSSQENALSGAVAELWGSPLQQNAPTVAFEHLVWVDELETVLAANGQPLLDGNGGQVTRTRRVQRLQQDSASLASSDVDVDLQLDQRRKGLIWFSLYDVSFDADWTYIHEHEEPGKLVIRFPFPVADGMYDDFRLTVDGEERWDAVPREGAVETKIPVEPGQKVAFSVGYKSRGRDSFVYRPVPDWSVGQVRELSLTMTTDFGDIDYPPQTMSPSSREAAGGGWKLGWDFRRLVTGQSIGMVMPSRVQAGPLATSMALSAPISLGLYMVWIFVLGLLKRIDIHPINHLFLAAAFFSFHLLFGYVADHVPVEVAFVLAAVVSLTLTTSYLRLVVGPRFALIEAGIAQLLYLVGFSLAHFWEGWTGLSVTVLGIVTLFALMQMTGRIRWSRVLSPEIPGSATG